MDGICERLVGILRSGTPGRVLITGDARLRADLTEASRCRAGRPAGGGELGATHFEEDAELDVRRMQDIWIPLPAGRRAVTGQVLYAGYLPPLNRQVQRSIGLVAAGDW
jgi:hypothetical protein